MEQNWRYFHILTEKQILNAERWQKTTNALVQQIVISQAMPQIFGSFGVLTPVIQKKFSEITFCGYHISINFLYLWCELILLKIIQLLTTYYLLSSSLNISMKPCIYKTQTGKSSILHEMEIIYINCLTIPKSLGRIICSFILYLLRKYYHICNI